LQILKAERDEVLNEKMRLTRLAEEITEAAKDIQTLEDMLTQLEIERKRLHFWNWKRKPKLDMTIEQTERDRQVKGYYFGKNYHVVPKETPKKIAQIQGEIKSTVPKIVKKNAQISALAEELAGVKRKYDVHKFRILKKSQQPPEPSDELTHITGRRPSVKAFMQELRQEAEKEKLRKEAIKKLRSIKPKRMLMITAPWQKKRRLASVIGKNYRRTAEDARPISALPVKETRKIG
jgi:chromosome segregation ATPase